MTKIPLLFCALAALAAASWGLELSLTPAVSYGACFLEGARDVLYSPYQPHPRPKTNEPLAAALDASFGRFGVRATYAHRYELYSDAGKVHDFELAARAAFIYRERWALYGVVGVGFSRAPVPLAFLFGSPQGEGFTNDWTPVAGAGVDFRPWDWLEMSAGVSYRERLQVLNFFWYKPYYGAVKSPSVNIVGRGLYYPWPWLGFGPTVEQTFYGPFDYYLYSETNRRPGWLTAHETYVLATLAFNVAEFW